MDTERRAIADPVETRDDPAGPTLSGYAALYDTPTTIAGLFVERIERGAFRDAVDRDDVRALFNHDPNFVLGRSTAGTLRLTDDARGLRYEVTLPDTTWARDLRESVRRGDISQSSFAFAVPVDGDTWDAGSKDQLPVRHIRQVTLYDVSPVTYPAYAETTVSARAQATAATETAPAPEAAPVSHRRRLAWFDRAIEWYAGR